MQRANVKKITMFYSLAVLNTVLGVSTLLIFNKLFSEDFAVGNIILSNAIVQLVAHYVTRKYIWRSRNPYVPEFFRFSATYIPPFVFSLICFFSFSLVAGINYVLVQVVASGFFSIIAFLSQKHFVFRDRK